MHTRNNLCHCRNHNHNFVPNSIQIQPTNLVCPMHAWCQRRCQRSGVTCSTGRTPSRLLVVCMSSASDQGDLYSILSVPPSASQAEIKAAYRRLVHDHHPDKHAHKQGGQAIEAATDAFLRCKEAYEVLTDVEQRRQYDESLAAAAGVRSGQQVPPQGQAWSPYNGWMDAYHNQHPTGSSSDSSSAGPHHYYYQHSSTAQEAADYYQTLQEAATATAAAGASSSGLSDYKDPLAAALDSQQDSNAPNGQQQQQSSVSATVRAALLEQHGLTLEQFGSLQDALAALAEREQQQAVIGLAEGDYDSDSFTREL